MVYLVPVLRCLFILLFLQLGNLAFAQDIIITVDGDTINCKITRITDENIHFSVIDRSGIILLRSRLPLPKIASYGKSDKLNTALDSIRSEAETQEYIQIRPPNLRIAIDGGFTYQFSGYEGLPRSYRDQVQTLWNIGGEISYFFPGSTIGLGIKYNRIATKAEEEFVPPVSSIFGFSELEDELITFNYFGLTLAYRNELFEGQYLYYFMSAGSLNYRSDGLADGVPFYQEGSTFGLSLGFMVDVLFTSSIGVGFGAEILIGNLTEFDNNGTIGPADFNISRLDLSVGFRFFK